MAGTGNCLYPLPQERARAHTEGTFTDPPQKLQKITPGVFIRKYFPLCDLDSPPSAPFEPPTLWGVLRGQEGALSTDRDLEL